MSGRHQRMSRRMFLRNAAMATGGATLGAWAENAAAENIALLTPVNFTLRKVKKICEIAHGSDVWDLAFNSNGSKLATAAGDGVCKVITPDYTAKTHTVSELKEQGNDNAIWSVEFSPGAASQTLLTASDDQKIATWDLSTSSPVKTTHDPGHSAPAHSATYNKDGSWIASGDWGGYVCLYKGANEKTRLDDLGASSRPHGIARTRCSPSDEETVAAAGKNNQAVLWPKAVSQPRQRIVLPHANTPVTDIVFHPEGTHVVTTTRRPLAGNNNRNLLNVWSVGGKLERSLSAGSRRSAYSPVVYPGAPYPVLAAVTPAGAQKGYATLWDWGKTNGQEWRLETPVSGFAPGVCAISEWDSNLSTRFLAVGYSQGLVGIWTHDGNMNKAPQGYAALLAHTEGDITAIRFHPTNSRIFATSSVAHGQHASAAIWEITDEVETVAFPMPIDGKMVDFLGVVRKQSDSQPLAGAITHLVDFEDCCDDATDASGNYYFPCSIEGDDYYWISAYKSGYLIQTKKRFVDPPPSSVNVDFYLFTGSNGTLSCPP